MRVYDDRPEGCLRLSGVSMVGVVRRSSAVLARVMEVVHLPLSGWWGLWFFLKPLAERLDNIQQ